MVRPSSRLTLLARAGYARRHREQLLRQTCRFALISLLAACGGNGGGDEGNIALTDAPGGGGGTPTSFNWTIRQQGAVSTCGGVGVSEVLVTVTPENGQATPTPSSACLLPGRSASRQVATRSRPNVYGTQGSASASALPVTIPATGAAPNVHFYFDF